MENTGENKNGSTRECNEQSKEDDCKYCCIFTKESIHSRRCFMTGEYCSQQANIRYEREKLHKNNGISAFVIMNFSHMSDIVYHWRLYYFIESLAKYLYFDKKKEKLYCHISEEQIEVSKDIKEVEQVKKIHVSRSDSDLASNYVTCTRICQQMQIADLIIVDVSSQNANVFYELGMAVAFGKLILPICYSESYYKTIIPNELKAKNYLYKKVEHHIGCFPWRKNLFEYYGIQFRRWNEDEIKDDKNKTCYMDFDTVTNVKYGFSDAKYNCFPYHEDDIGRIIYNKLKDNYNKSFKENNTLVIYTIERFLNKDEAGRCIVNFYRNIVARMRQERCFYGERVGVLVQENFIEENDRDTNEQRNICYSIGEIIHLGVNRATYLVAKRKDRIKRNDVISKFREREKAEWQNKNEEELKKLRLTKMTELQRKQIKHYIKKHIRNKGILIYPNNPVYVKRVKNGIDKLTSEENKVNSEEACKYANMTAFCLYHVMLGMLHNTNEIVVDISNNCLQSLFWLGAAHGLGVYAIPVLYEKTDKEIVTENMKNKTRNIFDVAGLGTAILHSNDIDGFYKQLTLAQKGIERQLFLRMPKKIYKNREDNKKNDMLQFYYLNYFWKHLLKYNQLQIYLSQSTEQENYISESYFQIVGVLSNYLSKRTPIGEYEMKSFVEENEEIDVAQINCICIGKKTTPLKKILLKYTEELKENDNFYKQYFETNDKEEVGQFVLWRENSQGLYNRNFFYTSITGISEKIMLAVTSLLVNEEQDFLCKLQEEARRQFMEVFRTELLNKLKENLGGKEKWEDWEERYMNLVEYTVTYYLNTVLFRYFFPFLTDRDIERIYNGMKTLINSMRVDDESPFCIKYPNYGDSQFKEVIQDKKVEKIIDSIPILLKEILESFRGLKVLIKEEKSSENLQEETISYNIDNFDIKIVIERKNINCYFECK